MRPASSRPSDGETVASVRRRLGSAVKASGKNMQIKRVGAEIFFWEEPSKPRGGRPRKNANPDGRAKGSLKS